MTSIRFFEKGKGQPVVLIHGFCEIGEMWEEFANVLSQKFRVICPDLPGVGKSELTEEKLSLEEIAVQLENWMDEQRIEDPIVIGHSLGGYVTLALAELMGQRLKAIGLFHSTAFPDNEDKKGMRDRTVIFLRKHGVDKFVTSFVPPLFPEKSRDLFKTEIEKTIEQGKKCSLKGLISFTLAMRDRKDRFEVLQNFPNPKLMIAGELDTAVPIDMSRAQKNAVTHYIELEDTGHVGMIEKKNETIEILKNFCEEVM